MSDIIQTKKGTYNLSTTEGQWKYLCEFLAEKIAKGTLWTSLNRLYESALKPDPRDELIRVYEKVIETYKNNPLATRGNHYEYGDEFYLVEVEGEMVGIRAFAETALAQGAEIKKRMEEG